MASIKIKGDTSGSTTITAPATGSDETIELSTVLDAKAPLASPTFTGTPALPDGTTLAGSLLTSGKILQIVRATDSINRSTTSAAYSDVTGMAVTITPQKSDSAIFVIATVHARADRSLSGGSNSGAIQVTDSSNNGLSGAESSSFGDDDTAGNTDPRSPLVLIGYSTPATTSATTYKLRFLSNSVNTSFTLENASQTGQMLAIEVSA